MRHNAGEERFIYVHRCLSSAKNCHFHLSEDQEIEELWFVSLIALSHNSVECDRNQFERFAVIGMKMLEWDASSFSFTEFHWIRLCNNVDRHRHKCIGKLKIKNFRSRNVNVRLLLMLQRCTLQLKRSFRHANAPSTVFVGNKMNISPHPSERTHNTIMNTISLWLQTVNMSKTRQRTFRCLCIEYAIEVIVGNLNINKKFVLFNVRP